MSETKKIVLKMNFLNDKCCKTKVMVKASGLSGVESISLDKDQKLTVIGDVDPVMAAKKLSKLCHTEIISVGPAKEPEKKKEEPKKSEPKKTEEPKKDPPKQTAITYPWTIVCQPPMAVCYYPDYHTGYYRIVEEDPPACVIL